MSRLTKHGIFPKESVWFIDSENNYISLVPCEMKAHHTQLVLEKLAKYEDKEEQGVLIYLPCKVGDSLYQIGEGFYQIGSNITEYTVTAFTISLKGVQICVKNGDLGFVVNSDSIGERFFRTRFEAEEALAKVRYVELKAYFEDKESEAVEE